MSKLFLVTALIFVLGVPFAFARPTERRSKPIPVSEIVPVADGEGGMPRVLIERPVSGVKYQTTCENINPEVGTIIQHDQVGSTYFDYQSNGSMGRMIAVGPGGHRHMAWHYTAGVYPGNPRYVYYNCKDSLGNWLGDTLVDGGTNINAGYPNMGVLHDGRAVVIYHRYAGTPPWYTSLTVQDSGQICSGYFTNKYDLPDNLGATEEGIWPKMGIVYDTEVDTDYIHVVMTEGKTSGGNQRLGYTRCHLIAANKLLCETPTGQPDVVSPITVNPNAQLIPNKNVAYFGETAPGSNEYPNTISAIVVTSPVSQKVAVVFTNKREAGTVQVNNDVFYFESTNNGIEWFPQFGGVWPPTLANGMLHNVSNYQPTDMERAYTDVAACYDYNDSLHIVWNTLWYDSAQGLVSIDANLYHWSKATGISLIAEGYWGGTDPGAWNLNISKMNISAMDPVYHPGGDPDSVYLYCIWTQFDSADNSANGYTNGDIYGVGSRDGGASWGYPSNLTNTKTPGCLAGNCLSEHWSSLAQDLHNGNLHIEYVCDRDAGGAIYSEGSWTDNPVMYLELQAWNPDTPLVAYFSASPTTGFAPLNVNFTDRSYGRPTSWLWDFGDGNTDTLQNSTHTYTDTGYFDVKLVISKETETDSLIKYDYIHVLPFVANFSAEPESGLPPLSVQFTDLSVGHPTSWLWHFGDGDSSMQQNPVHVYSCDDTGYFDVRLIIWNQEETDTLIKQSFIYVSPEVRAKFGAVKTSGVLPLTVQFIDSSFLGCPTAWLWDFGDGNTDTVQNPTHIYNDTGYFDVKLVVSNETANDSIIRYNYIHVLPFIVNFSAEPISGLIPLQVQFTDSTQGNPTSWRWDSGEGSGDTLQNPLHVYSERGDYDVKLVVSNAQYIDSLIKQDYIHAQIPPCPGDPNDLGICDTLYVETFDGDHIYDATGGYDSVRVGIYVTHDLNTFFWSYFPPSGKWVQDSIKAFVIPLKFWKEGCADSVVLPGPDWGFPPESTFWNNVDFTASEDPPYYDHRNRSIFRNIVCGTDTIKNRMMKLKWNGLILTIADGHSCDGDSGYFDLTIINIDKKNWYEGSKVLLATLTFLVYMKPGCNSTEIGIDSMYWEQWDAHLNFIRLDAYAYTPRHFLPVVDTIFRPLIANFAADKRCGSAPLTVAFSDSSSGSYPITSWHWNFGDGDTSNLQNPTHVFQDTGVFDITLVVSDGVYTNGLTKKDYVTTQDSVSADFFGLPNSGRSPLTVMFEPILEGIANYYLWDFGDGDTSTLRNPIHIYTTQGKYDVKLKVRLELDDCNQVDSMIREDYVIVNDLKAQFSANPTAGVAPLLVQFTDESGGNPNTWFWDFGDGNTISGVQSPSHQYDTAGLYDVFLRVNNSIGEDSLLKLDYIRVDTLYADLFAEIWDVGARPGFNLWFYCAWTNIGTNPAQNCTLRILHPQEMTFSNVSQCYIRTGTYSGYTLSGDTIIIPLQTINPSVRYGGYVKVYGYLPETVPIGDTLVCEAWLTSPTSEQDSANNHVVHLLVVTGSIDPNDKLAYPEGEGLSHAIKPDQRLAYTIQFENKPEATAEAIYIRVVDTLDQNLDWGTLAIGASSHPEKCDYEFDPYTGVIEWFCDSIMLPPNVNPPEGEGYFTYSISPKPDLPNGRELSNTAWIRFDYNPWLQAPEEGPVIRTIKYPFIYGDANGDGVINVTDVVYLINYLFLVPPGPAPIPPEAGDVNCDGVINVTDVVYLINYLFLVPPGPPPGC
jgi:PKD repeat protein